MEQEERGRRLFPLKAYSTEWPEPRWVDVFKAGWVINIVIAFFIVIALIVMHRMGDFEYIDVFFVWWREIVWISVGLGIGLALLSAAAAACGGNEGMHGYQYEIRANGFEVMPNSDEIYSGIPEFYHWRKMRNIDYSYESTELRMMIEYRKGRLKIPLTIFPEQIAEFKRFRELDDAWSSPVFVLIQKWRDAVAAGEPDGSGQVVVNEE
jgi:hypothetical protein